MPKIIPKTDSRLLNDWRRSVVADNTRTSPREMIPYKPVNTTSEFILDPYTGKIAPNPKAKMGLEIVSPEFDVLSMVGGFGSMLATKKAASLSASKAASIKVTEDEIMPIASKFKSEINWKNWNKEIPENINLLDEYHNIEKIHKQNGSWMKNQDGSEFNGSPEQFVQQNSSNFKKAFPNSVKDDLGNIQYNYHGSPNKFDRFDESKFKTGMFGKGVYTSPNKNIIEKGYAKPKGVLAKDHTPSESDNLYQLYIDAKNQKRYGSTEDFMDDTNYADITHFGKRKEDFPSIDDIKKNYPDLVKQYNLDTDNKVQSFYNTTFSRGNNITRDQFKEVLPDIDFMSFNEGSLKPQVTPFHKARIKSARNNNGMFDMTNPNIYKAVAPIAITGSLAYKLKSKK